LGIAKLIVVSVIVVGTTATPLSVTVVAPGTGSRCSPVSVTTVPAAPSSGDTEASVGGRPVPSTTNGVWLVAVTPPAVTEIGPLVAFAGTVTSSALTVADSTSAVTPLNLTAFALAVELNP